MTPETVRLPDGRRWQVLTAGRGPDLLWLHGVRGIPAHDPLLQRLAAHRRVIAPLAPGFGDADELEHVGNVHDLALAYDDLRRHLGLERPVVVGHSFGGMIAAELAAHFPDAVSRLVLLAPFGLWDDARPVADIFAVPAPEVDSLLWHDMTARDALWPAAPAADPKAAGAQIIATAMAMTAVAKFLWPIPDKGLNRRLKRITARALLVFGAADAVVPPAYVAAFARHLRQPEIAVVDRAGHMLPYERTDEVAALIARFLG